MVEHNAERAAKIAGNIKVWQAQIEEFEEAIANAKDTLASMYEVGTENPEGEFIIHVYQSKSLNAAYAKSKYPDLFEKGSETGKVFNATTAKKLLTEEEYELCQKPSDKVSVRVDMLED